MSLDEAKKVFQEAVSHQKVDGDGLITLSAECRQAISEWGDSLLGEKPKRVGYFANVEQGQMKSV